MLVSLLLSPKMGACELSMHTTRRKLGLYLYAPMCGLTRFRLVDCFASYFGSFTCVDFSEDAKLVIVGRTALVLLLLLAEKNCRLEDKTTLSLYSQCLKAVLSPGVKATHPSSPLCLSTLSDQTNDLIGSAA